MADLDGAVKNCPLCNTSLPSNETSILAHLRSFHGLIDNTDIHNPATAKVSCSY